VTKNFTFWAQALDNSSPDHFEHRGKMLLESDVVLRQETVSLVSQIVKSGECVYDKGDNKLTADGRRFLLEVLSVQRDNVGRTAPIVCCGEYEEKIGYTFVNALCDDLNQFTIRIGRNLPPNFDASIRFSFIKLKRKSAKNKIKLSISLIMFLVLLAIPVIFQLLIF
jgi:hypothetical protein